MKYRIGHFAMIALAFALATGAAGASVDAAKSTTKPAAGSQATKNNKAIPKMVDINSASKAELKSLSGIDDARANKIIAGRPYLTKALLVTRNIIPAGVYEQIKDEIIARQK